jgi:hypothetical protein
VILDDQERDRFAQWLKLTIESNESLINAAASSALSSPGVMAVMRMKKAVVLAAKIILKELTDVESFTVG